jgi:hypothetical protein
MMLSVADHFSPSDPSELSASFSGMAESRALLQIATAYDVAAVFQSDDPLRAIDAHLAKITEAEAALAEERVKWEKVKGAAELVVGAGEAIDEAMNGSGSVTRRVPGRVIRTRRTARRAKPRKLLNERQAAALKLLQETPGQDWRLRELVAELVERQWLTHSEWLDNQLAKDLPPLVERGLLEKPMKGVYRLASNTGASTDETTRMSAPAQDRAALALERAGRPMSPSELFDFLGAEGLSQPASVNTLNANLWSAAKAGRIRKLGGGRYATLAWAPLTLGDHAIAAQASANGLAPEAEERETGLEGRAPD